MEKQSLQIRMDSCRCVIRDVHDRLVREDINPAIVKQLQHLSDMLSLINQDAVTESELAKIEGSTNQLLNELEVLFTHKGLKVLYEQTVH